jgi:hypothetical protein
MFWVGRRKCVLSQINADPAAASNTQPTRFEGTLGHVIKRGDRATAPLESIPVFCSCFRFLLNAFKGSRNAAAC